MVHGCLVVVLGGPIGGRVTGHRNPIRVCWWEVLKILENWQHATGLSQQVTALWPRDRATFSWCDTGWWLVWQWCVSLPYTLAVTFHTHTAVTSFSLIFMNWYSSWCDYSVDLIWGSSYRGILKTLTPWENNVSESGTFINWKYDSICIHMSHLFYHETARYASAVKHFYCNYLKEVTDLNVF